ncbi:DUF1569 domain-containing protein [Taibaiella soli]|uniref:DUF1569 domain-containing protein n=1 Tax=Taibaiella soli TaxID=1649169 RepID=A0A2W2ATE9_9BACT|nr:DUF1569 domain-containing protein [Taibaiella soli]PZF71244.1 hypothetical protein DN068_18265 [Taibaiella soli]
MKTIYDPEIKAELLRRIDQLSENSTRQWGKMNAFQMVRHCALWEEMALGRKLYKRAFIGRIFGRIALNSLTKDERPLSKGSPTIPDLVITDNGDIAAEKLRWKTLIEEHANHPEKEHLHPFFGNVTGQQSGQLAYKHADHHLRQFGI